MILDAILKAERTKDLPPWTKEAGSGIPCRGRAREETNGQMNSYRESEAPRALLLKLSQTAAQHESFLKMQNLGCNPDLLNQTSLSIYIFKFWRCFSGSFLGPWMRVSSWVSHG